MGIRSDISGFALKGVGSLFNAWAGSHTANKIAKKEAEKNRDLLLMNARRRNESALENAENRLQSTHALGVFNSALSRQTGQNAVTGASNSRVSSQRGRNNEAMANIAGQQSAVAAAQENRLLDEQGRLIAAGYDAQINRLKGQRDAIQQAGTDTASIGDSILMSGVKRDNKA